MAKAKPLPPIDELRKRLAYRSDGVLIWKRIEGQRYKPGCVAGTYNKRDGYFQIGICNSTFRLHRVIWGIIKREDPLGAQIDHINGNKADNRVENLRKATDSQNKYNLVNVKGYYFDFTRKKWLAQIAFFGKRKTLGRFDTEEQAREAYLRAKEKLHGEFMPSDMKDELGHIDGPASQLDLFND